MLVEQVRLPFLLFYELSLHVSQNTTPTAWVSAIHVYNFIIDSKCHKPRELAMVWVHQENLNMLSTYIMCSMQPINLVSDDGIDHLSNVIIVSCRC